MAKTTERSTRSLTYQTDPLEISISSDEQMADLVELLRSYGWPRLVFTIEAEDKYDLWRRLDELNQALRAIPAKEIPYPEGWGYEGGEPS